MKNLILLAIIIATTTLSCENSKKEPQKEVSTLVLNTMDTMRNLKNSLLLEEGDTFAIEGRWSERGKNPTYKMIKDVTEYLKDSATYTHHMYATFETGCIKRKVSGVFLLQGVVIK